MPVFRTLIVLVLVASGFLFAMYGITGRATYKRYGLMSLAAVLVGALVFFSILILERVT